MKDRSRKPWAGILRRLLVLCGGALLLGSPSAAAAERSFFAMDTYITMKAEGQQAEEALERAEAEVHRMEELLSTELPESEIYRLNQEGEAELSEETLDLLRTAQEIGEETAGAFNITVYPLMRAWGFPGAAFRVPEEEEIRRLLPLADPAALQVEDHRAAFLKEGMAVDLGGIAKGYASERLIRLLREAGVESALVNLGGNVQTLGGKADGSPWRIGIESPERDGTYLGILEVRDLAVITSGNYERYFEEDGKRYHHILDPASGYPAENGLVSVSVISEDGTLADALSTGLFVMGREEAIRFWREHPEAFEMILLDEEGMLWVSEGLEDSFAAEREETVVRRE